MNPADGALRHVIDLIAFPQCSCSAETNRLVAGA